MQHALGMALRVVSLKAGYQAPDYPLDTEVAPAPEPNDPLQDHKRRLGEGNSVLLARPCPRHPTHVGVGHSRLRLTLAQALTTPYQRPHRRETRTHPSFRAPRLSLFTSPRRYPFLLLWFRYESEADPTRTSRVGSCRERTPFPSFARH